jgi:hypothetical protein
MAAGSIRDMLNTDPGVLIVSAHLDNLAHAFMTQHVTRFHLWDKATHEMEVGTADRASRHLDDGVTFVFDLRVGNLVAANVASTVIDQSFHDLTPPCVSEVKSV